MFRERLQQVSDRIDGALALSLVAKDGMPVESVSLQGDLDLEMLAAELMAQVRAIAQNHEELAVGGVRQLAVCTDRMNLMVSSLSDEYYLLLVTGVGANQGRARFELRRAGMLFEQDLA